MTKNRLDEELQKEIDALEFWVQQYPQGVLTRSNISVLFTALKRKDDLINQQIEHHASCYEDLLPLREFLESQLAGAPRTGQQTGLILSRQELAKRALELLDRILSERGLAATSAGTSV